MSIKQASPPPPPPVVDTSPIDFSNDATGMTIICSILLVLATISVVLRFYSKHIGGAGWHLDDWLCLAALIVHHGLMTSSFITCFIGGLGRDIRLVATEDPNNIVVLFKALLAAEVTYGFSSSLVKLSVLAFYWRIFPTKTVRWGCYILGTMCILWTVVIQIANFLQCRPLAAFWHLELQALPTTKCIDPILYFLGNSIANCIIDLATIMLPIRDVMKLHTTTKKKIGIAGIFFLGGIAFAASLVRTITTGIMHRQGNINFTKQFVVPGVTTVIEIYVAIIGACLPTMVTIYRKLRYGDVKGSSAKSYNSKTYYASGSNRPINKAPKRGKLGHSDTEGSFERLHGDDTTMTDYEPMYKVNITGHDKAGTAIEDVPMQTIVVKSDLDWSEQAGRRV